MKGIRAPFRVFLIVIASWGILLTACQVRGAQVPQSPVLRFLEGKSGLISFIASDGNVHVIDQAGAGDRALTSDAGSQAGVNVQYGFLTWSPDGTRLAFARFSALDAEVGFESALYTWRLKGREPARIFESRRLQPFYLYWSPDSVRLSVLSSVAEDTSLELGVLQPGTSGDYQTLDRGSPYYWHWLRDSSSVVVHVNSRRAGADDERLSLLRLDPHPLRTDIPVGASLFQAPDVSADGKTIAYVSETPEGFSLRVSALDGSGEREIAHGSGGAYFSFSSDGKRIAYLAAQSSQPVPQGSLAVVSLAGNKPAATLSEGPVLAFFWAPNGRTLAYLVPDAASGIDAAFLRDDRALYLRLSGYDPGSGKSWTIARFPISIGMVRVLPFFDQYQRSDTIWSPNSRFVVFTAYAADGASGLFVARWDGNVKPRFVASGDSAFWSPR